MSSVKPYGLHFVRAASLRALFYQLCALHSNQGLSRLVVALGILSLLTAPPAEAQRGDDLPGFKIASNKFGGRDFVRLMGRTAADVERAYGPPERVTGLQTIYNLPGQKPLRWMFYQREALLVGIDNSSVVRALLILPSFEGALPSGLRMEMKRATVEKILGRPDHEITEEGGTIRLLYLRRAYDLTFDKRSDTLAQFLYYPALVAMAPTQNSRKTPSPVRQVAKPAVSPKPKASETPRTFPPASPTPVATPRHASKRTQPMPAKAPNRVPRPSPRLPSSKLSSSSSPDARSRSPVSIRASLSPKPHSLPPSSALVNKTGSASIVGLVSHFHGETGEIQYLQGVQFYIAVEPLDPSLQSGAKPILRSQWITAKARHRARIWELIRTGKIISGIESDRYGRFKFQALPAGKCFLIGVFDDSNRYMVWQRSINLANNRQYRTYLNRNNVSLISQ